MTEIDTLVHARWVVPVEPADTVLEHHAVAVTGGRIVEILPTEAATKRYQAREVVHLADHALIPGLVNAHTHAAMSLLRGLADDLPLMTWLEKHVWPAEARWVAPEFVRDGVRLAAAEMLRGGTTCFNDMYFFPDATAQAVSQIGIRASIGMIVIDFPSAWASGPAEYLAKGEQVRDDFKGDPLLSFTFAPHAPYTVSDEWLSTLRTHADELEVPIHMHVHETHGEIEASLARHGKRPLARLDGLGLVSPALAAVHMTQLEPEEIERIARQGASVVHCPQSNLKLASGFCPVARLAAAGVNLALGTDGAASNNDLDMLAEMQTAALLAKGVAEDATALPAHAALGMATLGGARALGLGDVIGSLEAGKAADMVALDMSAPETQPMYDVISQIVYAASRAQVSDVWVAGQRKLENRRLAGLDLPALHQKAEDWRERITAERDTQQGVAG